MGFFTVNFTNFHLRGSVNIEFLPFGRDSFESLPITYQFNQLKHATAFFPLGSALHCGGWSQRGNVPVTKLRINGSRDPIEALEGHPRHSTRLIQHSLQNSSCIQHSCHSYYLHKNHAASAAALATMTLDGLTSIHIYSRAFNLSSKLSI